MQMFSVPIPQQQRGEFFINVFFIFSGFFITEAKHLFFSATGDTVKCKVAQSYTESMTNESEMTGGETPAREADEEGMFRCFGMTLFRYYAAGIKDLT